MSFLVCHVAKFKAGDLRGVSIHNNRESSNSSNKDIDYSRTELNFDALTGENGNPHTNYRVEVEKRLQANYRGERAIRSDAVRLVSVLVSSDHDFFADMDRQEVERYFKTAAEYLSERVGASNVVAAKVHMDETTPHMHFTFVPLTEDGRLAAKEITSRANLRSLQDELPKVMQRAGFDVQRGVENTPRRHLSERELKRQTELNEKAAEQEKQEPAPEKPPVELSLRDTVGLIEKYITVLNEKRKSAQEKSSIAEKMIATEAELQRTIHADITNGETTKVLNMGKAIKREEAEYNAAYDDWAKSKPSGFFKLFKYNDKGTELEKWKAEIDNKKAVYKTKLSEVKDKLKELLNNPEVKRTANAKLAVLDEQNNNIKKQFKNYRVEYWELGDRIGALSQVKQKLSVDMYTSSRTITLSQEVYQGLKSGDVTKTKGIGTELHRKADELRKIQQQELTKLRSRKAERARSRDDDYSR